VNKREGKKNQTPYKSWIYPPHDWVQWRALVNETKKLQITKNAVIFSLFGRTVAYEKLLREVVSWAINTCVFSSRDASLCAILE